MSWMQTHLGHAFDPVKPDIAKIDILDIAHALSLTCRYGGHSRIFYSVAEHSVLISHTVSPEHALWALLHDATEAYMGDLIHPLKVAIPGFSWIEDRLMMAICDRFELFPFMPEEVRSHDLRIVVDEAAVLLGPPPQPWEALEGQAPLGVTIEGWAPHDAESRFLHRFNQLTHQGNKENSHG